MVQDDQRALPVLLCPEPAVGGPVVDVGVDADETVSLSFPSDASFRVNGAVVRGRRRGPRVGSPVRSRSGHHGAAGCAWP